MYQERQGLLPQSTQGLDGAFILPSAEEAHMAGLEKEEGETGFQGRPTSRGRAKGAAKTPELFDPLKTKVTLPKLTRFSKSIVMGTKNNCDESRKTPKEREEVRQMQTKKYGRPPEVIKIESSQISSPNSDLSSSPLTYVPPEDPQILAKLSQPEIDLSVGAKIPRGLPDPLDQYASIIKSITDDQEIAGILIEEQMRGNLNGPGSSQIEPFSFNPLHRWGAPDADDYGPDSRP